MDDAHRIVLLLSRLENPGDASTVAGLERALGARGHSVLVLVIRAEAGQLSPLSNARALAGAAAAAGSPGGLRATLQQLDPDVVITLDPAAHLSGQWAAWRLGIPVRIASHLLQRRPGALQSLCDRIAGSWGLYSKVVAPSHAVFSGYADHPRAYRRRLAVVPRGMAIAVDDRNRRDARRALRLPANGRIALATGPLERNRAHHVLIEALARSPKVILALTGDGPERRRLEDQIRAARLSSRVRFLGEVDPADLGTLLRASDLFLDASQGTAADPALIAAMGAGLTVLASDTPCHVEVLTDARGQEAGLLVPFLGDIDAAAEAWSTAMTRALAQTRLRRRLASAATRRAQDFSLERMAEGYERAFLAP